jgi:hypothetical protein
VFAFNLNLRRYIKAYVAAHAAVTRSGEGGAHAGDAAMAALESAAAAAEVGLCRLNRWNPC